MSRSTTRHRWIWTRRGNKVGPVPKAERASYVGLGWLLIGLSAFLTLWFAIDLDVAAYTEFRGQLATARGRVVAVEPTGTHEPGIRRGSRSDLNEIVAVRYTFIDADRIERGGVSYRPGARPAVGATVTVEYPVGRPEVSRLRGYRTAKYASVPWGVFVPAVMGVVVMACGYGLIGGRGRSDRDGD